jgi:hypothetical protein
MRDFNYYLKHPRDFHGGTGTGSGLVAVVSAPDRSPGLPVILQA